MIDREWVEFDEQGVTQRCDMNKAKRSYRIGYRIAVTLWAAEPPSETCRWQRLAAAIKDDAVHFRFQGFLRLVQQTIRAQWLCIKPISVALRIFQASMRPIFPVTNPQRDWRVDGYRQLSA